MNKITFELPKPPSVNTCYATDFRTKRRFKTKAYKAWIDEAKWMLLGKRKEIKGLKGKIAVQYIVEYPKDKRIRDITNYVKPLDDFLVAHELIEDDHLIQDSRIRYGVVQNVQVTIKEVKDDR